MAADEKLYFQIRNAIEAFVRVNNRLECDGEENIPGAGGALICPPHANYSDPFFIGAAIRGRVIHFLAWHGIAEMPVVGPLFKRMGTMHSIEESYGVALNKEQAREVLGGLRALLEQGELCCLFPEGAIKHWINPTGDALKEFKPGAVRLAAEAGVPIIPAGITGARWVMPNVINLYDYGGPDKGVWAPLALPVKVKVRFGEPFYPDPACATDPEARLAETERLKQTMAAIMESMK